MLASKVTSKYQATIPRDVREFLHLKKGDRLAFQIKSKEDQVIIKRLESSEEEYLQAVSDTLLEWSSLEDDEAYDDL